MNVKVVAIIVISLAISNICQSKTYYNYSLYGMLPTTLDHLRFLKHLENQKYIDITFWRRPTKLFYDVQFMVSPTDKNLLLDRAKHFKTKLTLLFPDIQNAFDKQLVKRYLRFRTETYSWGFYHTLEDIYQWLTDVSLKYSDFVKLVQIGKSSEGREILALVIKNGNDKKQVLIEGGIHGQEWVAVEFVIYLANQLISKENPSYTTLANNYNWYLIPILNPDGYDYNHRFDRMYNKNRNNYTGGVGVNLNRNFDYSFEKFATSADPNDEDYGGPYPFSEPETQALRNFIKDHLNRLHSYVAIHSYGQKIVIPYSDRVNHLGDYFEMENYAKQAMVEMYNLYGLKYDVGTFYDTMGMRISGNSASWVKKTFRVKRVFTLLLRDNGYYGYALPPDKILPACQEAMTGLLTVMTTTPRYMKADPFSSAAMGLNSIAVLIFFDVLILILK